MNNKINQSMSRKLVFVFIYTSVITLVAHFITYVNINYTINKFDSVYTSNTNLMQLSESLKQVQEHMYQYLKLKNSSDLEAYYISIQEFQGMLRNLNEKPSDYTSLMMESHIRKMSKDYLSKTNEAVQAKRGRNIKKYNDCYNSANQIYGYINAYISRLNTAQFQYNSYNYLKLRSSLKYLELASTVILLSVIFFNGVMLVILSRRITHPLILLSNQANEIARGNLEIDLMHVETGDEIEILAKAFNKMIGSIKDYIQRLRERMEIESQMKEKELLMENHLKDAQLKYLQAQINPHFLFNTLNAGVQLAMMEGAERTSEFIENMAEFFRYNIARINQETTLEEEVQLVDHYIYIINVRFSGEISYIKEIDDKLLQTKVPSMILQPIVENVFQYGIRDIEWQGKIKLTIAEKEGKIWVSVKDNGKGMSEERIKQVLSSEISKEEERRSSNGIGLHNVVNRLCLFYGIEEVLEISSEGMNKGTEVVLKIPLNPLVEEGVEVRV